MFSRGPYVDKWCVGGAAFRSVAPTCRHGIGVSSKGILAAHLGPDTLTYTLNDAPSSTKLGGTDENRGDLLGTNHFSSYFPFLFTLAPR